LIIRPLRNLEVILGPFHIWDDIAEGTSIIRGPIHTERGIIENQAVLSSLGSDPSHDHSFRGLETIIVRSRDVPSFDHKFAISLQHEHPILYGAKPRRIPILSYLASRIHGEKKLLWQIIVMVSHIPVEQPS
jgi:hypothetical protein